MFKYDPYQKSEEEIQATFISGEKYLSHILIDLKPANNTTSNQGIIIIGQRGAGKSHFLKMLYYSILNDADLKKSYFPVLFPEELFNVNSLFHLLKYALSQILTVIRKNDIPLKAGELSDLEQDFQDLQRLRFKGNKKEQLLQREDAESKFFNLMKRVSNSLDRKFIFLLENLQELMGKKLTEDELKRLRSFLQESPEHLLIIGTALTVFDRLKTDGEAFYNYFKFRKLTQLNNNDIISLLRAESRLRKRSEVLERIDKYKGEIEVFSILTGGNPRLCLFLYDLLAEKEELQTEDTLKKISELTPYFKEKTDNLSPGKQLVIDALCEGPPAMTVSEISDYASEPAGNVSENIKRLSVDGFVKTLDMREGKDVKKSQTFYCIKDYFYRIWYQVRQSVFVDENISWMAEVAVILFRERELSQRLKNCSSEVGPVYESALRLAKNKSYMNQLKEISKDIKSVYKRRNARFAEMIAKKDWQGLLEAAKIMIRKNEYLLEAYFYQGYALLVTGAYETAVKSFKNASIIDPGNEEVWYNMGNSYAGLGDHDQAIESYKNAISINTGKEEAWYNMGNSHLTFRDYDQAIKSFTKAVSMNTEREEAWYNLGYSYTQLGDHDQAIESYKKAISINNEKKDTWYNMGSEYAALGDCTQAVSSYLEFIKYSDRYPQFTLAAFSYIKTLAKANNDYNESKQDLASQITMLNHKIKAVINLVSLDKLCSVEAFVDDLFTEIEKAGKDSIKLSDIRLLYFFMMGETIWQIQEKVDNIRISVPAGYFLRAAALLEDDRNLDDKIREFIINAIRKDESDSFNMAGMKIVLKTWTDMDIYIPEFVYALVDAMEDPDSKTAQVWSADPLFKDIFELLSASDVCIEI